MVKTIKLSELLYYAFFLILFTTRIVGVVEGTVFYSVVVVVAMICFGISYMMASESIAVYILDFLLFGISLVSYAMSGEKGMILFFAMMIGIRYVSIERLFKVALVVAGGSYVIMLILGVFGWIPEAETILLSSPLGDITRRSISNLQVNVVMTPYLILMMMIVYIIRKADKKTTLKVYAILLFGLLYIYSYCFAKTALIVGSVFMVLNWIYRFRCGFGKCSKILTDCFYMVCSLTGILAPAMFNASQIDSFSDLAEKYPRFLSWYHRLYIGKYYLINNNISMLGQRLNDPNPDSIVYPLIHQSQLYLLLQYGFIMFLIVNLLYFVAINYYIKKGEGTVLAVILSYAFIGIAEPLLFNLSFKNISFVFIGVAYTELIKNMTIKRRNVTLPALLKDGEIKLRLPNVKDYIRGIALIKRRDSLKVHFLSVAGGITIFIVVAFLSYNDLNNGELLLIDYVRLIVSSFIWGTVIIGTIYLIAMSAINRSEKD